MQTEKMSVEGDKTISEIPGPHVEKPDFKQAVEKCRLDIHLVQHEVYCAEFQSVAVADVGSRCDAPRDFGD